MHLGERGAGRLRRARKAQPRGGDDAERDGDGLVLAQHQRGQAESGAHRVAAADAALALDGDAEVAQRVDVAAHGARVHAEPVGDLAAGGHGLGLEQLEQLEEAGRGREHRRE